METGLDGFRTKLDRELKAGVLTLVLLAGIARTEPVHGYRLLRAIEDASGGGLVLKEGTAYPLLQNMEKGGLIASHWGEGPSGPARRYYRITASGRQALRRGIADWKDLNETAARLLEKDWGGPEA